MAVGALAPISPTVTQATRGGGGGSGVIQAVPPGQQRSNAALPAPAAPGAALFALMNSGTGTGMPNRRPGVPPKEWGMSEACHSMRMKNVRRGFQPHFRPRAA
jgi:hypothetical protein